MKIEQRTVYIAEDGVEFLSEDACIGHEKIGEFTTYLTKLLYDNTDLREYDAEEVARYIAEYFGVISMKYLLL